EERLRAGLTQEQLASRIGTKKAYISRVENGHTDVQVSTLFKIFEGLGRRISINIL
ncbi:MAG: helix-turn-helix transcriptional regulator, partial [Aeriscardovia sp.]|nr:helix-turn-helix transcriptional regulator [Aeriscardovia sp.]